VEVREIFGVFVGGIITIALLATAINPNNKGVQLATAFTNGFASDIRAATFQGTTAVGTGAGNY
jgi:hypothetical protein